MYCLHVSVYTVCMSDESPETGFTDGCVNLDPLQVPQVFLTSEPSPHPLGGISSSYFFFSMIYNLHSVPGWPF